MTVQPHDFSRPPSLHPETRAKLVLWLNRTNARLGETIAGFAPQVEVELDECSTSWPINALQDWSDKAVTYRLKLADLPALSVIALPNPLAQILVGALLGEEATEWPVERDLTAGEQSVGEFLITSIANCMNEAWTGDDVIQMQIVEREQSLKRTRIFKFKEPFVVCRSTIRTPFGSAHWTWMLPHEYLTHLFGAVRPPEPAAAETTRQQLESLARDMSTEVVVRLGGVQLSAPQLASLRVGDLVVLNQKTTEPLRAMVSGKPRFLGWPGRVGNRQAFELSSEGPRPRRAIEPEKGIEPSAHQE